MLYFLMAREWLKNAIKWFRASRARSLFVVVGIPSLVLMFFVLVSYIVFFTTMVVLPLVVISTALLPRAVKTKSYYAYGLKISLIFVVAFTAVVPNPLVWGEQIYRRLDHRVLITPGEPAVRALNDTDQLWEYIRQRYAGATPETFQTWPIPVQAQRIYAYIRSLVDYTYDIDNNGVFDHVATPKEVLAAGKDDCQGISCVLVSLLRYLKYDAWICECPFHWYVRVFYVDAASNLQTYCDIYRSTRHTEPLYMFNEVDTRFPASPLETINATFTFDYIPRKFAAIVNGTSGTLDLSIIGSSFPKTAIPNTVFWMIVFGVLLLFGLLVAAVLNAPRFRSLTRRAKFITSLAFAAPLFVGFIGILLVPFAFYLYFALFSTGLAVIAADSAGFHLCRLSPGNKQ